MISRWIGDPEPRFPPDPCTAGRFFRTFATGTLLYTRSRRTNDDETGAVTDPDRETITLFRETITLIRTGGGIRALYVPGLPYPGNGCPGSLFIGRRVTWPA